LVAGRAVTAELAVIQRTDYSDACPLVTQRRYHMPQRSPIIFWLLLSATLAVDVVILVLVAEEQNPTAGYLFVTFLALILSQLSIICIWSAFSTAPNTWTRIAPVFAVVTTALMAGQFTRFPESNFTTYLGEFALRAVAVLAALWFLQRTNYWRRRNDTAHTWQFSVLHVLATMTITAILITLLRRNEYFGDDRWTNIAFACSDLALVMASVILWNFSWNWILRLASVIGIAVLLGEGAVAIIYGKVGNIGMSAFDILHAYYLIQAIVLSLWLGVGPILPPKIHVDEM
jgi:hypothetical protein